ncbi:hypothetical protein ACJ41O_007325 [Fusarium nematophilum]
MASKAELVLYTSHGCPWAHRAHIALKELNLPFTEVAVDLNAPRSPEYLKINPRGQVPTLVYNGEVVTESGVIAQFLWDTFPPGLTPPSNSPGAGTRFFADTYMSQVQSRFMKAIVASTDAQANSATDEAISELVRGVEPMLAGANPFFGGSSHLTLAEVLTGPFVVRILAFSKVGILPESLGNTLQAKAPNFFSWAEAVAHHPSVASTFDEAVVVGGIQDMRAKHTPST